MIYQKAEFLLSAARLSQLPEDVGYEVAFVGRSNAGKSTALNTLTNQKHLAKTSKTPGCTQLINVFVLDEQRRLIDLPGYGFAKVPLVIKKRWQETLGQYLEKRDCLRGVILLMDARHPFKEEDVNILNWCLASELPCHILLSKADKLTYQEQCQTAKKTKETLKNVEGLVSFQLFSAAKRQGLETLLQKMDLWYEVVASPSQ